MESVSDGCVSIFRLGLRLGDRVILDKVYVINVIM